jgi:hypothetical protein
MVNCFIYIILATNSELFTLFLAYSRIELRSHALRWTLFTNNSNYTYTAFFLKQIITHRN